MMHTKNLKKWSQILLVASYICLACVPLSVLSVFFAEEIASMFAGLFSKQKIILTMLWSVKPLILMAAFWQMTRLFSHFIAGDVLTETVAICIKCIGQ